MARFRIDDVSPVRAIRSMAGTRAWPGEFAHSRSGSAARAFAKSRRCRRVCVIDCRGGASFSELLRAVVTTSDNEAGATTRVSTVEGARDKSPPVEAAFDYVER